MATLISCPSLVRLAPPEFFVPVGYCDAVFFHGHGHHPPRPASQVCGEVVRDFDGKVSPLRSTNLCWRFPFHSNTCDDGRASPTHFRVHSKTSTLTTALDDSLPDEIAYRQWGIPPSLFSHARMLRGRQNVGIFIQAVARVAGGGEKQPLPRNDLIR